MTIQDSKPLVSIIVRTKDRPKLLNKALLSIAAQTYRPIEVILVNDGGCYLATEELKVILGSVRLNYIRLEKNTGRAHAGNVGLENAKGKYVGFLDDDDEFYPEHVITLVTFLEQGGYKVAYTGVEMVSYELTTEGYWIEDANSSRLIFSKDFSYADLLFANYIPFNSILFEKEALKGSGNMDEILELYEDWDFLIRIAQKNTFYHIKKNTAQYNQWSKELQINRNNADYMKATQLKIIRKHRQKITPEMILEIHLKKEQFGKMLHEHSILDAQLKETIMEKTGRIAQLEEVVMCKVGQIAQLEEEADVRIAELEGTVRDKDSRVSELEEAISGKDSRIAQLEEKANEKENHIIDIENTINSMRSTIGWKMLEKFREHREKTLPLGTKRRNAFDLSIKSAKYIRREGYGGFFNKVRERYKLPDIIKNNSIEVISVNMLNTQIHSPLMIGDGLYGGFHCPLNNLKEIKILTATATRDRLNSALELTLMTGSINGRIIRQVVVKGKVIRDGAYTVFKFKPLVDIKGDLFFRLKSLGPVTAAVWYNKEYNSPELKLYRDGSPLEGSINFQAIVNANDMDAYQVWIVKNEPDARRLEEQRELSRSLRYRPKVSIVTPVYNIDRDILKITVESVINQTYDNWELCLADGASSKPHVKEVLESYSKKDKRIKIKLLAENKGISGNSNEAISMATGEFIALLDHDDALPPFALFEVARAINERPELDFIYSDRDMITMEGKRHNPYFKPDWSPDYLLSCNYLCHLNVFSRSIIEKTGGFREAFDGSQDYDIVLRVTELTDKIRHIPKILYHWRTMPGSAANSSDAKPYAYTAALKALQEALKRRGYEGTVEENSFTKGLYNVKLRVNSNPKVSIIIPSKDNSGILSKCISSILNKTTYKNYEIVLVDNQSNDDKTFEYYRQLKGVPQIKILEYGYSFNFSKINNFGVSKTDSEYIVFLNNDTELITGNWLELMLGFAQRKDIGAVGVKLLYPDETIQHAGLFIGVTGYLGRSHHKFPRNSFGHGGRIQATQNLSAVAAACMMMRRGVFEGVGGFDARFEVAHGDIDLCLKLREKDLLIVYLPFVELYHYESYTRGYEDTDEKKERFALENSLFIKQWGHILKNGDPYYNPNLTVDNEDFAIRI